MFIELIKGIVNSLGAKPKKWSNSLKQFVGCCHNESYMSLYKMVLDKLHLLYGNINTSSSIFFWVGIVPTYNRTR